MIRAAMSVAAFVVSLFALIFGLGFASRLHNEADVKIDIKNVWDHTTYVGHFEIESRFTVIDAKTMSPDVMRLVVEREDGVRFQAFHRGERTFVPGETVTMQNHKYDSGKVPFDVIVLVAVGS